MLAIKSINPDAIQNVLVPFKPKNSSKCTRITDIIQRFLVSNTIKIDDLRCRRGSCGDISVKPRVSWASRLLQLSLPQ